MSRYSSLAVFLLAILLIIISIRSVSPPVVKQGNIPDSSFSVNRAYTHLLQISRLPHSIGTVENARVREYIATACRQFGCSVEIQNATSVNSGRGRLNAAKVYNVIARKKGLHNSKAVLLMAHYDSQPNTPGAGDDGANVAAMLETARALQAINPLQNDLILLFTDGEEIGLMGANAFVKESPLMKEIGLAINFEGRGNAGPANMFEVNAGNGWAINGYSKSVKHPFANSLGYEIYKRLPNYTDFTPFKNAGITGLNNAYIEGFVNYHSPNDKPQHMDLRSMQQQGENMLSLTKHFGNLAITNTKAKDASYFNVIGNLFVHYPASWNLVFVLLTDLLFIVFIVAGIRTKGAIKIGGFVISTLLFPVVLAILYFAAKYLLKLVLYYYPMYSHFDENNGYNSAWYFFAMSSLAVAIFSSIYWLVAKKINGASLLAGMLVTAVLLVNMMQLAIPSASYLLFIPLLFILGIEIFKLSKKANADLSSGGVNFLNLLAVVPAIILLAPIIDATFIAFALGNNMNFVVIGVGVLTGLLLPVLDSCLRGRKIIIPAAAFFCFAGAMIGGQVNSHYSAQHPLQSSLRYVLDADSSKAKWISDFSAVDKWSATFFKNIAPRKHGGANKGILINDAPAISLLPPTATIVSDTLANGMRTLVVHINPAREKVTSININIADSSKVRRIIINGKEGDNEAGQDYRGLTFTGITASGIDVLFELEPTRRLAIVVSDRSIGLPAIPGFNTSYPIGIIPASGGNSNTTQVSKHFEF